MHGAKVKAEEAQGRLELEMMSARCQLSEAQDALTSLQTYFDFELRAKEEESSKAQEELNAERKWYKDIM